VNVLDGVDTALISADMGMGIGGVGLLCTTIAVPVVLGLEIAALTCGVVGGPINTSPVASLDLQ